MGTTAIDEQGGTERGSVAPITRMMSSSLHTKWSLTSLYVDSEIITSTPYFLVTPTKASTARLPCRAKTSAAAESPATRNWRGGLLGGHVLQRASVDDGFKPYVSAQRGSNKY